MLKVQGYGFGVDTVELNLAWDNTKSLCELVTVTGYGTFDCLTKAYRIKDPSLVNLKIGKNNIKASLKPEES